MNKWRMELQVHSDQEKTYLIIINNGPYGDERAYNGFRLAMNLQKHQHGTPDVFLMGDGVQCHGALVCYPNNPCMTSTVTVLSGSSSS